MIKITNKNVLKVKADLNIMSLEDVSRLVLAFKPNEVAKKKIDKRVIVKNTGEEILVSFT